MVSDYLAVALGQKIDLRKKVSDFAFVKNFMAPFFRCVTHLLSEKFVAPLSPNSTCPVSPNRDRVFYQFQKTERRKRVQITAHKNRCTYCKDRRIKVFIKVFITKTIQSDSFSLLKWVFNFALSQLEAKLILKIVDRD